MLKQTCLVALLAAAAVLSCFGQESDYGLSVPVTASVGLMHSGRLQLSDPSHTALSGGARFMFYPAVKLGTHWFAYAAVQTRLSPYFYYDAFFPKHEWDTDLIQAFVGYSTHTKGAALVFKAGKLSTAFGSFPLRYDDLDNPLLDQPLSYITELPLRADQLICGTSDLLRQHYGSVSGSCGGEPGRGAGLTPVTLYGVLGAQVELSSRGFDARLQTTTRSPSNPQGWTSSSRYIQWTAGAGYSIRPGLRVGASAFTGPYMAPLLAAFLPGGTTVRDFPATARGLDVQWARGRWSVNGEWQHFRFGMPGFVVAPSIASGYAEAKAVLTPRLFLAARAGWLKTNNVLDTAGVGAAEFASLLKSYEVASGFWLGRRELLKVSYSWLRSAGQTGTQTDVVGFELVTHFNPRQWAFR